jgi:hypothetical protein
MEGPDQYAAARLAAFPNERAFQAEVMTLAKHLGLVAYHTHRSDRSVAGFPDLVIVGHRGVLYRELKMPGKRPTKDQVFWIAALNESGADAGVWRPKHWPTIITEEMRALGKLTVRQPEPSQTELRRVLRKRGRRF